MAKASEFVRDILEDVTQLGAEQPIQSADAQKTIRYMNDLGEEWAADGTLDSYTLIAGLGDDVSIPGYANAAFKVHTTIRLLEAFGKPVSAGLLGRATTSLRSLLASSQRIDPAQFPSTLPVGSGNECRATDSRFYDSEADEIALEYEGSVLTESNTE